MNLADILGSAESFLRIGEIAERIASSANEEELVRSLRESAVLLGASSSYFITLLRKGRAFSSCSFLLACDPVWAFEYEQGKYYEDDPWLAYAQSHSTPVRGTEVTPNEERARAVLSLAERFGFRSSVVAPAPSSGNNERFGLLVLGSDETGFFERAKSGALSLAVRAISMSLHERRSTLAGRAFMECRGLEAIELDLLRHQRQGHSSKTIAHAMKTSSGAVDARFGRLIRKLRCPDRQTAASVAAANGLI